MSHSYEPSSSPFGHNLAVTGVGFEESGQVPLSEANRAVLDTLVLGVMDLYDGTNETGVIAFQNYAADPDGDSNNFRNHFWNQVGVNVVDADVLAQLAASEQQGTSAFLSHEEAKCLEITIAEDRVLRAENATRRMAAFFAKTGVIVFEEVEFPIKSTDGTEILKRELKAQLTKR